MTKEEYNNNPNICKYCGNEIICNDNKKLSYVLKRKYCSIDCYYNDRTIYNGSGIYCIKNKINNKMYIGQSTQIERRLREHKSLLRNNHYNIYSMLGINMVKKILILLYWKNVN